MNVVSWTCGFWECGYHQSTPGRHVGHEGFGLVQEPLLSGFCGARCLALVKPVVEARDRPPVERGVLCVRPALPRGDT